MLCTFHEIDMATTAIDKGMPIKQVQRLLGHEKIDTTLHYYDKKNVKLHFSRRKKMAYSKSRIRSQICRKLN